MINLDAIIQSIQSIQGSSYGLGIDTSFLNGFWTSFWPSFWDGFEAGRNA